MFYDISSNGNTFLIVDDEKYVETIFKSQINNIADGLVVLKPSISADHNFIIYNKDGTRAHICGNGLLASTYYLQEIVKEKKDEYLFLTDSGYYKTQVRDNIYSVFFPLAKIITASDNFALINSGNLHAVKLVDSINPESMIEEKEVLPTSINLHHVAKETAKIYSYVSLESGVGFTESCLSGAASIFSFLRYNNMIDNSLTLRAPGGEIGLELKNDLLMISGRVKILFKGYLNE